jgi:hypothetical protein
MLKWLRNWFHYTPDWGDIGVTKAVSEFNMGCIASQKLKEEATNLKLSLAAERIGRARDDHRLKRSTQCSQLDSKSARKKLRLSKVAAEDKEKLKEGPTYGSGQF